MKLQPLRIEAGWEITYNLFYEIDPTIGFENYFDGSSLLMLRNNNRKKIIDICWRPELDLNGHYQLEVLNFIENFNSKANEFDIIPNWEEPYLSFQTKSRVELVEKLEELMLVVPVFIDHRILKNRGVPDEPSESYRIRLANEGLSTDLIDVIIANGNSKIQNLVLDRKEIEREAVLLFSIKGISKKIKNKAHQMLNSKRFNK